SLTEALPVDQPACLERVDRNAAVDALEESWKIGNLGAAQTTFEQRAQRKHSATLFPHSDDDFVDTEMLHRLFQRQMIRHDATRRDTSCRNMLERVEPRELQAGRIRHVKRRFDSERLGTRSEHQDAVR